MRMNKYNEIFVLKRKLEKAKIPFRMRPLLGGYQIGYPTLGGDRVCSIIEHSGSYGNEVDKLEIMGLANDREDSVEGYLTADDVFNRIQEHYQNRRGGGK